MFPAPKPINSYLCIPGLPLSFVFQAQVQSSYLFTALHSPARRELALPVILILPLWLHFVLLSTESFGIKRLVHTSLPVLPSLLFVPQLTSRLFLIVSFKQFHYWPLNCTFSSFHLTWFLGGHSRMDWWRCLPCWKLTLRKAIQSRFS